MLTASMAILMSISPAVMSATTSTATASLTVQGTCDVSATDILFGTLTPGADPDANDKTSSITQPTGNTVATLNIQGSGWSGNPSGAMASTVTHWSTSSGLYSGMTALNNATTQEVTTAFDPAGLTMHFKAAVPNNQIASVYTQTITFTVAC